MRSLTRNIHTFKFMYLSIRHYFVVFVSKHRCTFAFLMMIFARNEKQIFLNAPLSMQSCDIVYLTYMHPSVQIKREKYIWSANQDRSKHYSWITDGSQRAFSFCTHKKQPKICTYVCPEAKCIRQESLQKWMAFSSSTKLISESEKNRWYFRMQNYLINLISLRKFINMLNTFFRISLYFQHKEKHFFTG